MNKQQIGKKIGAFKVWQTRLAGYIAMINFVMLFYLFIGENSWFEWYYWVLLIVITCSSIIFIDIKFVYPNVLSYTFVKNPEFMKLKRQTKENAKKLDLILNHLNIQYKEGK